MLVITSIISLLAVVGLLIAISVSRASLLSPPDYPRVTDGEAFGWDDHVTSKITMRHYRAPPVVSEGDNTGAAMEARRAALAGQTPTGHVIVHHPGAARSA